MLYVISVSLMWLLPIVMCWLVVFDGDPPRIRRGRRPDGRVAAVPVLGLAVTAVLWHLFAGSLGPIRLGLALARREVPYQTLLRWSTGVTLCLPAGVLLGMLIRVFAASYDRKKRSVRLSWTPVSSRTKGVLLLTGAVVILGLLASAYGCESGARQLRIVEFCRRQQGVEHDVGYVVLKNEGSLPNRLQGLCLSTDADELRDYHLAEATVAPGETVKLSEDSALFVQVRREGGQTVYLSDASGRVLDELLLPALPNDVSVRYADGAWVTYDLTRERQTEADAAPAAPSFSEPGGFYDSDLTLTLSAEPGCAIYYTLDGGIPDDGDTRYTGPIDIRDRSAEPNRYRSIQNVRANYLDRDPIGTEPVDKACVVRAVAVGADGSRSDVVTQTYFVGLGEKYAGAAAISLVSDPEALFGEEGIYVTGPAYDAWYESKRAAEAAGEPFDEPRPAMNFMQRGAASERAGNLELYDEGACTVNQPVGLRIQGNTGRVGALKRFSIYSRAVYSGSGTFSAPVFPGRMTHAFVLRSGFDNAFCHLLAQGRDVAVLPVRPVSVFLDGEFWYRTYMLEKYNDTYFHETYGIAKGNVEIVDIGNWNMLGDAEKSAYRELLTFAETHDMSAPENYEALCRIADMQSYMDYLALNVILGNADCHEQLNTMIWRTKLDEHTAYGDGRWRWALNDMDLNRSYNLEHEGVETTAALNSFTATRDDDWPALASGGTFYEAVCRSPVFREQFVLTFLDLLNTTFSVENTTALLESLGKGISYDDFFYRDRAGYMQTYLKEEFGLTGALVPVTFTTDDPEAGTLRINTVTPTLSDGTWTGSYFADYPVTLTAEPAPGHTFDHWEINGARVNDAVTTVRISGEEVIAHAVFR